MKTDEERQPEQESGEETPFRQASSIAVQVERLRRAAIRATQTRSRLPQPLFWSLFNSRIADIRSRKLNRRILEALFGPAQES